MNSPAEQATVGVLLRTSRERAGLSLKDIAQQTCIRRTYLEALEADRFDLLPGQIYVRGFVRIYANLLHLDAESLLAQAGRQEAAESVEEVPAGVKREGMPALLFWALLTLLIVGVAGGLLYKQWPGASGEKAIAVAAPNKAPAAAQMNEVRAGEMAGTETNDETGEGISTLPPADAAAQ